MIGLGDLQGSLPTSIFLWTERTEEKQACKRSFQETEWNWQVVSCWSYVELSVSSQPASGDSTVTLWRLTAASSAPQTACPTSQGLHLVPVMQASTEHLWRARTLLVPVSSGLIERTRRREERVLGNGDERSERERGWGDRGHNLKCISRWETATIHWVLSAGSNTFFHSSCRSPLSSPQCQLLPYWHTALSMVAATQWPWWAKGSDLHSLLSALSFHVLWAMWGWCGIHPQCLWSH